MTVFLGTNHDRKSLNMSKGKVGAELVSVALNEVTYGLWNRYARFKFCVYNFLVFAHIASSRSTYARSLCSCYS
jgi:hypothetical protein